MTLPINLTGEIQKLEPSAVVELFELDATNCGGPVLYFHAGTNGLLQPVVWKGVTYTPFPLQATGFDLSAKGQLPRPKLTVSNAAGSVSVLLLQYNDLSGAKITRRRTLVRFLDAVNFSGGNPDADPEAGFIDDVYFVDRKSAESYDLVEFELAASLDLQGVMLPRRAIIQNSCSWKYRGTECGYTGTAYFTYGDVPTTDAEQDVCGKRLSSCKCRFGQTSVLPFGGFPAAGLAK